jgi:hypothetical protein
LYGDPVLRRERCGKRDIWFMETYMSKAIIENGIVVRQQPQNRITL